MRDTRSVPFKLQGDFEPEPKRLRTLSQVLFRRLEDCDDEWTEIEVKIEVPRLLSLAPEWLRPRPSRNENILFDLVLVALLGLSSGKGVGARGASGSDRALGRSWVFESKVIFFAILCRLIWVLLGWFVDGKVRGLSSRTFGWLR